MTDIKEHQQIWCIILLIKKTGTGAKATSKAGVGVDEELVKNYTKY